MWELSIAVSTSLQYFVLLHVAMRIRLLRVLYFIEGSEGALANNFALENTDMLSLKPQTYIDACSIESYVL